APWALYGAMFLAIVLGCVLIGRESPWVLSSAANDSRSQHSPIGQRIEENNGEKNVPSRATPLRPDSEPTLHDAASLRGNSLSARQASRYVFSGENRRHERVAAYLHHRWLAKEPHVILGRRPMIDQVILSNVSLQTIIGPVPSRAFRNKNEMASPFGLDTRSVEEYNLLGRLAAASALAAEQGMRRSHLNPHSPLAHS